jgi:hypothetical protein
MEKTRFSKTNIFASFSESNKIFKTDEILAQNKLFR